MKLDHPYIINEGGVEYRLGELKNGYIRYDFEKMLIYLDAKGKLLFGKKFRIYKEDREILYKLCCYFIKDKETCDKFGIDINKGILLTGPVGCGKSTLLKTLAGLYRPGEGRVRLGDADLWEIDPQLVASQVGYLPQNVHLFKGTLRSNLALSGASGDSRLLQITRELGIDEIAASSPQGMDLPISEGGEGLSGGQRQLVALGRVLINQPRIWLLDEPTASLDGDAERRVWTALESALRPDDILVVATHRPLAAARLATRVIVMQQGQVVRDGPPEVVLAQLMGRPENPTRLGKGGNLDVV